MLELSYYSSVSMFFRFKIEGHLKKHRLTHIEVPQFKCDQCDKAFRVKNSLKKHLETHTGVVAKPHICDYCGMGFRHNVNLKVFIKGFFPLFLFTKLKLKSVTNLKHTHLFDE